MATNTSPDQGKRLPWAGKLVRPEHIEDELTFLWHLAADNMRISQNMNVRTSVLNLVICALDIASAHKASMLLRDLPNTHIARVMLVVLDTIENLPSEVTTWVTVRSFPIISDIMRHHFEQVTALLSGAAIQSAPTIVQPMLKPDLPVYLWWVDDLPCDNSIFRSLITISNRVIIDSSTFSLPEEHIRTLSSLLQASPSCRLSDFNWSRITIWRELVAQFFDVAEYRPYMANIEKIEIEHAVAPSSGLPSTVQNGGPNPIRALALAAWLKTRLGWQLSEDKTHFYHDARTGTYFWHMTRRKPTSALVASLTSGETGSEAHKGIDIRVGPRVRADLQPGTICLIRLTSTLDGKQAVFSIDREDDDKHVITSVDISDSPLPQRVVHVAATHKEIELLNDELEIMGHDRLYEETLHEVFNLLGSGEEE